MARFDDPLELLGASLGLLLVLIGLATIAGQPWQYSGPLAGGGQLVGGVVAIAVGAGLAWLTIRRPIRG